MKTTVLKYAIILSFVVSLLSAAQAQHCRNGKGPGFPTPSRGRTNLARPECGRTVARPTQTAGGVPIRYVNVPIPSYAGNRGRGGYGYGYGYGAGGYGYGYGTGMYNYSGGASASRPPSSASTAPRQRQATRRQAPAPNPQSARNYRMRKLIREYTRENSLGGKLYLRDGGSKWLLSYSGQPKFRDGLAIIPCRGRQDKGPEQKVTLTLSINGDEVVQSEVSPSY